MHPEALPIIETERLSLRPFTDDDAHFILHLLNSENWLKYIGNRQVIVPQQAINYLHNGPIRSYAEHGFGPYMVTLKADNEGIGLCGLIKRPPLSHPDLGFAFLPEYEGKGYAFEAAQSILNFGMNDLKIQTILAITTMYNIRSQNLIERLGLQFQNTLWMEGDNEELMLYSTDSEARSQ